MFKYLILHLTLMRCHQPIGFFLLLWPIIASLLIFYQKHQIFDITIWVVFILGVFLMRSAGCIINDIFDAKFDKFVKRTKNRPLTSNQLSKKEAIITFVILLTLACGLLFFLNWNSFFLAIFIFLLICFYPLAKRFFFMPQIILGCVFNSGIFMVWIAHGISIDYSVWILFFSYMLFTVAYDSQYAKLDIDDDLNIGIKSSAIFLGKHFFLVINSLYFISLILLIVVGLLFNLGYFFYSSLIFVFIFIIWQAFYLQKDASKQKYFFIFKFNQNILFLIALSVFLDILIY